MRRVPRRWTASRRPRAPRRYRSSGRPPPAIWCSTSSPPPSRDGAAAEQSPAGGRPTDRGSRALRPSEVHLQRKLDDPWISARGSDLAERTGLQIGVRVREVRVIEKIEELAADLHRGGLRDAKVLQHPESHIPVAGAAEEVLGHRPDRAELRLLEVSGEVVLREVDDLSLGVSMHVSGVVCRAVDGLPGHEIGTRPSAPAARNAVVADTVRKRRGRLDDGAELPAPDHLADDTFVRGGEPSSRSERKIPDEVPLDVV